jgi:hypothetical protein
MSGMMNEARKNKAKGAPPQPPSPPIYRLFTKEGQGYLWSFGFGQAGRDFEACMFRACEVLSQYVPLSYTGNDPNGKLWDIFFHSSGLWAPSLEGFQVNLKGHGVKRIANLGGLEKYIPFEQKDRFFTKDRGRQIVREWLDQHHIPSLRLLAPASREFQGHFMHSVYTRNWQYVARLLAEPHWRHTHLGHRYWIYFSPRGPVRYVKSVSISRIPFPKLEQEIEQEATLDPFSYGDEDTLFDTRRHVGYYPRPLRHEKDPKALAAHHQHLRGLIRQWHTRIRPELGESLEDDARVFMYASASELQWRLTSPDLVDQPTNIITPHAYSLLMDRLPPGRL